MTQQELAPIPQPPETPLLGNLLAIDRKAPIQGLVRLAKQYGPIYQLKLRGQVMVVVSGASLASELCDQARFGKIVEGALLKVRAFGGNGLVTADTADPDWSKAHNILLPNFSQRAIQSYHSMMLDIAGQLVDKWARLNPDDEVDVARDMTSLTLDTIGACGFDYRFNSFYRETYHPFVRGDGRCAEAPRWQQILAAAVRTFYPPPAGRGASSARHRIHERHGRPHHPRAPRRTDEALDKPDLLNSMLAGIDQARPASGSTISISAIRSLTFLIAGP